MRVLSFAFVGLSVLALAASPALAANREHFLPLAEAMESDLGKERLLDVPVYLEGQKHRGVKRSHGTFKTQKSTRGLFRADTESCVVAALSAILALQQRAQAEGGNAVINIKSITRGKITSSATDYRCVAGNAVVHVFLEGEVVSLK